MYYDVTNYYFEIDEQDNLRKKGVSKEHRPDPIIQMGLLMDGDGIPITYSLFPGNTKVTKSDFRTRQVYVSREDHIQAHFLVCFVALVIARLLERRLDNEYTIGRIASSLRRATCTLMGENHYVFHHADEVTKAVLAKTGIDLEKRYRSLGEIKKVLAGANKTKTAVQS
ncbi:hypothetical protein AGMMS49992_30990 [Clostridia bacterium]|nr:hypothetical protein AGMMS49992_30990 [Clostridia bacterium]